MMTPILAALLAAAPLCSVTPEDELSFESPVVRLGDLVVLDCIPPHARARIGGQALLDLSQRPDTHLSRTAIASLARRRAPILRFADTGDGDVVLRMRVATRDDATSSGCLRLLRSIGADTLLVADMVTPVACPDSITEAQLHRDPASGFARTSGRPRRERARAIG